MKFFTKLAEFLGKYILSAINLLGAICIAVGVSSHFFGPTRSIAELSFAVSLFSIFLMNAVFLFAYVRPIIKNTKLKGELHAAVSTHELDQ